MSDRIGAVDTAREPSQAAGAAPAPRHLQRVAQGQRSTGVCTGIAAYAEVRVDWVRTFFVLATVFTAGLFGLVYVALTLILTVDHTSVTAQAVPSPRQG